MRVPFHLTSSLGSPNMWPALSFFPFSLFFILFLQNNGREEARRARRGWPAATGGRELGAAETTLRTGGIEGSNVEPIVETTAMVDILRAYQTSMKMSQDIEDMRRRAIDRLGKLG